jgi:hypothetical protein
MKKMLAGITRALYPPTTKEKVGGMKHGLADLSR